jgi:hypothetical protein
LNACYKVAKGEAKRRDRHFRAKASSWQAAGKSCKLRL